MIVIKEACPVDGPRVIEFLLDTPIDLGTAFALDRRPDFDALLRMRGAFRTFVAETGDRVAGVITALWHRTSEESSRLVGEIVDLRIAPWARGGRVAFRLLNEVRKVFEAAGIDWVLCLIGDRNAQALTLIRGHTSFPALFPLTRYESVHLMAWRGPVRRRSRTFDVRPAGIEDAEAVEWVRTAAIANRRLAPLEPWRWPDRSGSHRAWLARDRTGRVQGGLVVWDGSSVRRLRVVRYAGADRALQLATRVAGHLGLTVPMPTPGNALKLWASRWLAVAPPGDGLNVARVLINAALQDAVREGQHVLQINLPVGDPLLNAIPWGPRAATHSTLYGRPLRGAAFDSGAGDIYHADVALI